MNRTDDQFWDDAVARHDLDDAELRQAEAMFASEPATAVDPKWVEAQVAKVAVVPMRRPFVLRRVIRVVAAAAALLVVSVYVANYANEARKAAQNLGVDWKAAVNDQPNMTVAIAVRLMKADTFPIEARDSAKNQLMSLAKKVIDALCTVSAGSNYSAAVRGQARHCLLMLQDALIQTPQPQEITDNGSVLDSTDLNEVCAPHSEDGVRMTLMQRVSHAASGCVTAARGMINPTPKQATELQGMTDRLLREIRSAL